MLSLYYSLNFHIRNFSCKISITVTGFVCTEEFALIAGTLVSGCSLHFVYSMHKPCVLVKYMWPTGEIHQQTQHANIVQKQYNHVAEVIQ